MAEEKEESQEKKEEEKGSEKETESRTLTQEEINKLIEGARKQEKDKLYDTITSLRDKVNDLSEDRKRQQEEREKSEKEVNEKAEQERMAKLSAEDRLAEQLNKFEERLAKEAQAREKLELELEEERQKAGLEKYRAELLAGENEIIPELVRGTTREELAESVKTSKARYQSIFDTAVKKSEGPDGKRKVVDGALKPADPDPDALDEESLTGLGALERPSMNTGSMKSREEIIAARKKGISPEYLKQKEQLLDKVGSLYKKSVRG